MSWLSCQPGGAARDEAGWQIKQATERIMAINAGERRIGADDEWLTEVWRIMLQATPVINSANLQGRLVRPDIQLKTTKHKEKQGAVLEQRLHFRR